METTRCLKIYGNVTPNAKYDVFVNGVKTKSEGEEIFSFETSTSFHGSMPISIIVHSGEITLKKSTSTYPAIFNNVHGKATIIQPIKSPVAVYKNANLESLPFEIKISSGQTLNYEHLMFNGPSRFIISVKNKNINLGEEIFIGDFLSKTVIKEITNIEYEYDYKKKSNDIFSDIDLENLKLSILSEKYK